MDAFNPYEDEDENLNDSKDTSKNFIIITKLKHEESNKLCKNETRLNFGI